MHADNVFWSNTPHSFPFVLSNQPPLPSTPDSVSSFFFLPLLFFITPELSLFCPHTHGRGTSHESWWIYQGPQPYNRGSFPQNLPIHHSFSSRSVGTDMLSHSPCWTLGWRAYVHALRRSFLCRQSQLLWVQEGRKPDPFRRYGPQPWALLTFSFCFEIYSSLFYKCGCFACMWVCAPCACSTRGGQKRA